MKTTISYLPRCLAVILFVHGFLAWETAGDDGATGAAAGPAGPGPAPLKVPTLADRAALIDDLQTRGQDLSRRDQNALLDGIRKVDAYAEYGRDGQHLVKHEIMTYLRRSTISKDLLADVLAEIGRDPQQHPVMRDYALQHTYLLLDSDLSSEVATGLLVDALAWRESTLAGTSLRALVRLHKVGRGPVGRPDLADAAYSMAMDQQLGPASRSVALQACGQLDVREALPEIRKLARQGRPIPVRVAAIHALAELGEPEDRKLLDDLAQERGLHMVAVRKALEPKDE